MADIKNQTITFTRMVVYKKEYSFKEMEEQLKDKKYTENQLLSIWKAMINKQYDYEDGTNFQNVEDDEFDDWFNNEIELVEDCADDDCRCDNCGNCIDAKQSDCFHDRFCYCESESEAEADE